MDADEVTEADEHEADRNWVTFFNLVDEHGLESDVKGLWSTADDGGQGQNAVPRLSSVKLEHRREGFWLQERSLASGRRFFVSSASFAWNWAFESRPRRPAKSLLFEPASEDLTGPSLARDGGRPRLRAPGS